MDSQSQGATPQRATPQRAVSQGAPPEGVLPQGGLKTATDWAAMARAVRFDIRSELRSGRISLSEVFEQALTEPLVGQIKLLWVLESLPGAQKVATRRRLAKLGQSETDPIGALDRERMQMLLQEFSGAEEAVTAESHSTVAHSTVAHSTVAHSTVAPDRFGVIVICGPGGVGKGTLVERLLELDSRLWLSRSWTTRSPRPGEAADSYHFTTRDRFEEHIERGGFIEWAPFLDYLQGSPLPDPPEGSDVLFEIDVQGASQIADLFPASLLIFVDAPSREVQEERMRGRGDDEERIAQRLRKAEEELDRSRDLGFVYVINDDLDAAVDEIRQVIDVYRKRDRQP